MNFSHVGSARRPARESVVPLVNIVFLLLIFFLLAGTLRTPDAAEIDPPEQIAGAMLGEGAVTLVLDRQGVVTFEGRSVRREDLADALSPVLRAGPVQLRADRRASAEHLLPLLEALERLGFRDVALVTREAS